MLFEEAFAGLKAWFLSPAKDFSPRMQITVVGWDDGLSVLKRVYGRSGIILKTYFPIIFENKKGRIKFSLQSGSGVGPVVDF